MRTHQKLCTALFLTAFWSACALAGQLPQTVRANWPLLDKNLKLALELRQGPAKTANSVAQINAANRKACDILKHSDGLDRLEQNKPSIDASIKEKNAQLESLYEAQMTVADAKESESTTQKIQAALSERDRLNAELMRLYELIAEEYALNTPAPTSGDQTGADPKQSGENIKWLLVAPLGKEILQNITVFNNVKKVTELFAQRLSADPNNLKLAQDYYDLYITLHDILALSQQDMVDAITDKWRPELDKAEQRVSETFNKLKEAAEKPGFNAQLKSLLKKNLETSEVTLKAVQNQKKLLEERYQSIIGNISGLKYSREALVLTRETLQTAVSVQDLIRSSLQQLDALAALSMPDLQLYSNTQLQRELEQVAQLLGQ